MKAMELKTYCANMKSELNAWKAKAYHLMRWVYGKASEPDETMAGSVAQLGDMIDELERKIDRLETECPANWEGEKVEVERMVAGMNEIWEDAWRRSSEKSPDDF
jgi:hypothetical protein